MEKILLLTTNETTTETIQQTMSEVEALNQINSNLIKIAEIENVILGILILFGLYGMYKALSKLINIFL